MIRVALQFLALILTVFTAIPAAAQQGSPGPRLDPALMEREFDSARRERERAQKSDVRLPRVAEPPSRGDTKPLFKLTSVIVNGANVFPRETIADIYRSYLGKTVSQADLVEIARLISELYREAGFHLSRAIVPPQEIKNGFIQIRVIEGRISETELKGTYTTRARQLLQPVVSEQPSRLETLERQLLLINDIPGNRIRETTLEEIGSTSGQFRLIVDIETWHVYSTMGLDNRGVPAIGPLQSHFSTALNSYFRPGDAAGLNLSTVPDAPRELTFGQLWYEMPVGVSGSRFAVSAAYGEIWPSDERRLTGIRTRSESFEARFTAVPLRTRKSSLWLTASVGFANVSESEDQGVLYGDHIRTVAGQWTPTPLLASQEFYLGGQAFGRGYSTGEISGDNGIAGSLEVRYDQKLNGEILKGYQLYGFVDGGSVRDFRSGADSNASLASAGGGIRINFANELEADIGLAVPLTYRSPANHDRHPRVFFVLSKAFKFCPDQFQMRCS